MRSARRISVAHDLHPIALLIKRVIMRPDGATPHLPACHVWRGGTRTGGQEDEPEKHAKQTGHATHMGIQG